MVSRVIYVLPFFLLSISGAFAADFSGQVVAVTDGDGIKVMHNGRAEPVRLRGIDCPEKRQAFGTRAKQATSALAFGHQVTVHPTGKDKYKRTLATVILPDGMNLNHELVSQGYCWWFRKYAPTDSELEKLEQSARALRKGLWVDPNPVPPWEYRKAQRRSYQPAVN